MGIIYEQIHIYILVLLFGSYKWLFCECVLFIIK